MSSIQIRGYEKFGKIILIDSIDEADNIVDFAAVIWFQFVGGPVNVATERSRRLIFGPKAFCHLLLHSWKGDEKIYIYRQKWTHKQYNVVSNWKHDFYCVWALSSMDTTYDLLMEDTSYRTYSLYIYSPVPAHIHFPEVSSLAKFTHGYCAEIEHFTYLFWANVILTCLLNSTWIS